VNALPEELCQRKQWVVWKYGERGGKLTKPPYRAAEPDRPASVTDPSTWATFAEAVAVTGVGGVGFVLTEDDPFTGIDLDGCRIEGELHPAAAKILAELDSWTERSPSGNGVHVVVRARLNGDRNKTNKTAWGGHFEVHDKERYLTVTGEALNGRRAVADRQAELDRVLAQILPPVTVQRSASVGARLDLTDDDVLKIAFAASNGTEIRALYQGDTSAYGRDDSAADMALADKLAFYCPGNSDQLDRLIRGSGLMREKWDDARGQTTYGRQTVEKALAQCSKFYEPSAEDSTVTDWDSSRDEREEDGESRETIPTRIVQLVKGPDVDLFHNPAGRPYATIKVDAHRETWPVRSRGFELYVRRLYYEKEKAAPASQALKDALGVIESEAIFGGDEQQVHLRIASDEHAVYIDLGDLDWRAIEITREGWRVLDNHPVRFRRTGGMAPLPVPVTGGDLNLLRAFINLDSEDDWRLVVGWLLAAARPDVPCPVLVLHGEQGSAKSTAARVLRSLIDPSAVPLRAGPSNVLDLMVGASSSWVMALDNISDLTRQISDALCRLATGGGLSKRQLYTDDEEILLDAQRPVVINGIADVVSRSDLLDRSVLVELPVIEDDRRTAETDFWRDFDAQHPKILGALLDAIAGALGRVGSVRLDRLPRMADFATFVTAAEPALGWAPGAFMASFDENRGQSHEVAVEASVIGPALRSIADDGFEGIHKELLERLNEDADERTRKLRDWPANAKALGAEVTRLAPNLRKLGYTVVYHDRKGKRGRVLKLKGPQR
jgi:hypothetical protein